MIIKYTLDDGAHAPTRAHKADAGADLRTRDAVRLVPGGRAFIDTGVHVAIPEGFVGYIKSKSGLMRNCGIITDGTVDAGYNGSIGVTLINTGDAVVHFEPGDKIAQLVIQPCELPWFRLVDDLDATERGANGFGSTGR